MIYCVIGIVVLVGYLVYRNVNSKKNFIKSTNALREEVEAKCGSFIEKRDRDVILGKVKLLKEIVIRKKYDFEEAAQFILYAQEIPNIIYENNKEILGKMMSIYLEEFTQMVGGPKEYIATAFLESYTNQFLKEGKKYAERSLGYESPLIQKFMKVYENPMQYLLDMNKEYIENELRACNEMFNDIDGKSLDVNQRNAVVNDDLRQLVVAGAGSGKTLTVAAKVKYLVERKGINPKDILLISFTRKSAKEMEDRIHKLGIDIDSSTFHKYGLSIIRNVNKKMPDIADDIGKYIDRYIKEKIYSDNKLAKDFLNLLGTLMLPVFDGEVKIGDRIEIEQGQNMVTLKEMYEANEKNKRSEELDNEIEELKKKLMPFRRKLDKMENDEDRDVAIYLNVKEKVKLLEKAINNKVAEKRTIRNEKLKSVEEVMLANYFFLDGVEYEYEKLYPYDPEDNYRKNYRPDFYLKDFDVYWEHFGIDKMNRAPQYSKVDEDKYLDGIKWKRKLHKSNETKLAETYSWQFQKNKIDSAINANYEKFGIKKKKVAYCDIIRTIIEGGETGEFESFRTLLSTFITLFKSYGYSKEKFDELRTAIRQYEDDNLSEDALQRRKHRDLMFLTFAEQFYSFYHTSLIEEKKIDFNDMIIQAASYINQGIYIPNYRYMIIDEYQDISIGRYKLAKETLEKSKAKLFCVGDDWQSIYRFTGSEVDLLVNFEKYFGPFSRTDIVQTYRNSQELLDISGSFIMANKYQTPKKLRSDKHIEFPIRIMTYTGFQKPIFEDEKQERIIKIADVFKEAVGEIVKKFPKGEILLLGRNNNDIRWLSDDKEIRIRKEAGETHVVVLPYPNVKIRYLTVHRSKGLEADNVIILNAKNARNGFPNQIVDDPILNLLRDTQETYPFAEERRLFYVALTRTRNYTYILAPITQTSRFLDTRFLDKLNTKDVSKKEKKPSGMEKKSDVESVKPLSCPTCKNGTLVKRVGMSNKIFVSCSNYPACTYTASNLEAVRENNRCPVCDNFLVKRNGKYGEFMGCMSYPYCTYTTDIM